jgi:hypothetical protein
MVLSAISVVKKDILRDTVLLRAAGLQLEAATEDPQAVVAPSAIQVDRDSSVSRAADMVSENMLEDLNVRIGIHGFKTGV